MKKLNTKVSKKIAVVVLTAVAAFSLMGCNVEKTVTTTTTETHTDADGNTTGSTTTTTTTNNNGKVTTETTTEEINEVEDFADEESDVAFFEKVPLLIANEMGWDVAGINVKISSSDAWSENFLGDDLWLNNGETMSGINVSYDEEDRFIDINVVDSQGEGVVFDNIELPVENNDEITILLEHDETDDSYHAYVVE